MEINPHAALVAQHQITINAPAAIVWTLLTEIEAWPQWNSAITRAQLDRPLAIGSIFRWTSGGTPIVSTIQLIEPQQRFGWTGQAMGTTTEHIWEVKETAEGTIVTTAESMSGWLIQLVKWVMPGFLDQALQGWLTALKQAAESQVGATTQAE